MRMKFDVALLETVIKRDKCKIKTDDLGHMSRETIIDVTCSCGKDFTKNFRMIYKNGAFCRACMVKKTTEKQKKTSMERYGVENPKQLPEIQEKFKKTMLDRYGVEHPSQSEEVKAKKKETTMKHYGVENPFQSEVVKEKIKDVLMETLGVQHPSQSAEVREKMRSTCMEKYGVEHALQSSVIREKALQTNMERYGVGTPLQSDAILDKVKQTNLRLYGVENVFSSQEIKDKIIQTNLERYGVPNPSQSAEVKERMKATNLERFGTEYATQNADVAEKASRNAYKVKSFTFPCGTDVKCQGFEPFALQKLVDGGYTHDEIITKRNETPEIWYDKDDKAHRYFCDLFIPSIGTIIEVKSTWTYEKDKEDLPLKGQACKDAGYAFELWVFDSKGQIEM